MSGMVLFFTCLIGVLVIALSITLVFGAVTLWSERSRIVPTLLLVAVTGMILAYLWVVIGMTQ